MLRHCSCGGTMQPHTNETTRYSRRCDKCDRIITQRKALSRRPHQVAARQEGLGVKMVRAIASLDMQRPEETAADLIAFCRLFLVNNKMIPKKPTWPVTSKTILEAHQHFVIEGKDG